MAKEPRGLNSTGRVKASSPPPFYAVVLLDDDYTPYDWVLKLLGLVFRKEKTEALRIAREVDEMGGAKVGVYTRDLAETLCVLVHQASQRAGYPLQARFERQ